MKFRETVAIQLPSYLKGYFIHRYGPEPVMISQSTKLFTVLIQYMTRKPKGWKPPEPSTNTLLIQLPFNKVIEANCLNYIPERSMPEIKKYIFGLFYGSYISYMQQKVIYENWAIKYAIINFVDEHNIDWVKTNYETLKKIFDRYQRPKIKKDKKMLATQGRKNTRFSPSPVPHLSPKNYEYF